MLEPPRNIAAAIFMRTSVTNWAGGWPEISTNCLQKRALDIWTKLAIVSVVQRSAGASMMAATSGANSGRRINDQKQGGQTGNQRRWRMHVAQRFGANQVENRACAIERWVVAPRDDIVRQQAKQHVVESRVELEEATGDPHAAVGGRARIVGRGQRRHRANPFAFSATGRRVRIR